MRRQWLWLLLLGALGAGAAFWLLSGGSAFIVAQEPLGDGQALQTLHDSDDGPAKAWVQLVDTTGAVLWRYEPTETSPALFAAASRAVADPARIYLYGETHLRKGTFAIEARDRSTGKRVWRTPIRATAGMSDPVPGIFGTPHVDGERLIGEFSHGDDLRGLIAHAVDTGAELWRVDAEHANMGWLVVGDVVALMSFQQLELRSAVDGQVSKTFEHNGACFDGEGFVIKRKGTGDLLQVAVDGKTRVLAEVLDDPFVYRVQQCGRYGGQLIMSWAVDETLTVVALKPTSGEEVWRWTLPASKRSLRTRLARGELTGRLPRFVAVLGPEHRPWILDLDAGKVVGSIDDLQGIAMTRSGPYFVVHGTKHRTAVIDGVTGKALGAVYPVDHKMEVDAHHLRDDLFWVYTDRVGSLDDVAWSVYSTTDDDLTLLHWSGKHVGQIGYGPTPAPEAAERGKGWKPEQVDLSAMNLRMMLMAWTADAESLSRLLEKTVHIDADGDGRTHGCSATDLKATGERICATLHGGKLTQRSIGFEMPPQRALILHGVLVDEAETRGGKTSSTRRYMATARRCLPDGAPVPDDLVVAVAEQGDLCVETRFEVDGNTVAVVTMGPDPDRRHRYVVTWSERTRDPTLRAAIDAWTAKVVNSSP